MKLISMSDILRFIQAEGFDAEYDGDMSVQITQFSNISDVRDGSISWVKNEKYVTDEIKEHIGLKKSAVIVSPRKIVTAKNSLLTASPKAVYFAILNEFFKERHCTGISGRATIETDKIGRNVSIAAGCYVCKDAVIGDDVVLHANVVIDCPCTIGKGTEIFAGTVIGADGFGYYHHNGIPERVPHFGSVVIGENVDIGANTCIDRGTLGDTIIENNVKIDNLCHIGHNVKIEAGTLIIAGATICGSVVVGKESYIAPESCIKNQVHIGTGSFVGMGTVLAHDVGERTMVFDQPARMLKNFDYHKFV